MRHVYRLVWGEGGQGVGELRWAGGGAGTVASAARLVPRQKEMGVQWRRAPGATCARRRGFG